MSLVGSRPTTSRVRLSTGFDGRLPRQRAYRREQYQEQGTDKTIQLIRDFAATEKVPYSHIIVDEDGVGGGVVDQMPGVKGFVAASSLVPTRTAIRRQMLPTTHITIDGNPHLANFQNLKAQCGFKLAELVETHKIAAKPAGDQDEIAEDFAQIRQKTWTRTAS